MFCAHILWGFCSPPFLYHHPQPSRLALAGFHEAPQVLVFQAHLKSQVKVLEDAGVGVEGWLAGLAVCRVAVCRVAVAGLRWFALTSSPTSEIMQHT